MSARFGEFATPRLDKGGSVPNPASISDAITQMDHNAVVLFTIDRLARSPQDHGAYGALNWPQTGVL